MSAAWTSARNRPHAVIVDVLVARVHQPQRPQHQLLYIVVGKRVRVGRSFERDTDGARLEEFANDRIGTGGVRPIGS